MVQNKVSSHAAAAKFKELHEQLRSLQEALRGSVKLSDSQKRKLEADIDAMREHLSTETPSPHTLRNIWSGIEHLVTAGDFVEHASRIGAILSELLPLELL
jgi:hypothetical protein